MLSLRKRANYPVYPYILLCQRPEGCKSLNRVTVGSAGARAHPAHSAPEGLYPALDLWGPTGGRSTATTIHMPICGLHDLFGGFAEEAVTERVV